MSEIHCGIIIALPEEYVTKHGLSGFEETFSVVEPGFSRGGDVFRKFLFRSIGGEQKAGIFSILHGMGPAKAMDITKTMIREFDPALMVNIGISGSLDQHVRLGDLVVAETSYDYTYRGKETDTGHEFGGKSYSSFYPIFNIVRQFWTTNEDDYWKWQTSCSHYLERAISTIAREQLVKNGLLVAHPSVHGGPVACGNDVVASEAFRQFLLKQNRNYLAVDMESAGFLQGCYEQYFERPRFVLRAISDLADHRKEKMDGVEVGGIRAWAMGNTYQMLATLLERALHIEPPSRPLAPGVTSVRGRVSVTHDPVSGHFAAQLRHGGQASSRRVPRSLGPLRLGRKRRNTYAGAGEYFAARWRWPPLTLLAPGISFCSPGIAGAQCSSVNSTASKNLLISDVGTL